MDSSGVEPEPWKRGGYGSSSSSGSDLYSRKINKQILKCPVINYSVYSTGREKQSPRTNSMNKNKPREIRKWNFCRTFFSSSKCLTKELELEPEPSSWLAGTGGAGSKWNGFDGQPATWWASPACPGRWRAVRGPGAGRPGRWRKRPSPRTWSGWTRWPLSGTPPWCSAPVALKRTNIRTLVVVAVGNPEPVGYKKFGPETKFY